MAASLMHDFLMHGAFLLAAVIVLFAAVRTRVAWGTRLLAILGSVFVLIGSGLHITLGSPPQEFSFSYVVGFGPRFESAKELAAYFSFIVCKPLAMLFWAVALWLLMQKDAERHSVNS